LELIALQEIRSFPGGLAKVHWFRVAIMADKPAPSG
jgi:hypothetical protein